MTCVNIASYLPQRGSSRERPEVRRATDSTTALLAPLHGSLCTTTAAGSAEFYTNISALNRAPQRSPECGHERPRRRSTWKLDRCTSVQRTEVNRVQAENRISPCFLFSRSQEFEIVAFFEVSLSSSKRSCTFISFDTCPYWNPV